MDGWTAGRLVGRLIDKTRPTGTDDLFVAWETSRTGGGSGAGPHHWVTRAA